MIRLYRHLRRLAWKAETAREIRRRLAGARPLRLQVGGGPNVLDGWLNTDLFPWRAPQGGLFHLDATAPLPFPDGSLDRIFTEHMVEHLEYDVVVGFLRECRRVLAPGGRIRVCTPDLEVLCRLYQDPISPEQRDYIGTVCRTYQPQRTVLRGFVVNQLFDFGHAFLFDEATLGEALRAAGFEAVARERPGASADPLFRGIDAHAGDYIAFETLVLEAARGEGAPA